VDSKNQPPDPYPRRRGRSPKPTDHPIGRLIRERRLTHGLSLAQLAEKVGIGPTSISLIAAMEHGTLPPRRDVAEKLADVLGIDRDLLIEWSSMRVSPHSPTQVLERRERFDEALRDAWETNVEHVFDDDSRIEREVRGTPPQPLAARLARGAGAAQPLSIHQTGSRRSPDRLGMPALGSAAAAMSSSSHIPVYPAGADPERFRGTFAGTLERAQVETLVQGKAELIRPIAYLIDPDDLERLRRPSYPETAPTYALISRPLPVVIDSREPYAIRYGKRVILAYCAWDGRELVVLEPPGQRGFARLKARNVDALEDIVVGQVVALSWFPIE
jgi:transcriptional regulator with XRE-family HTH domain